MSPDEFFGDGAFGDLTQVCKVRSILQVHVHAVTEAVMRLAAKCILVHAERVSRVSSAALEAL